MIVFCIIYNTCLWYIKIGERNEWISLRVVFDLSEEIPEFKVYTKNAEGEYEYAGSLDVNDTRTKSDGITKYDVDTSILKGAPIRDISMSSTETKGYVTLCVDNVSLYTLTKIYKPF